MLKKTLLKLMLAVLSLTASPGHAQNYPYRSDYLWVTVPDHRDWLYQTGEKATVDIQFYQYGMPVDTEITWSLSDDLQAADKTGTLKLKNGRATLNIGTRKTPGFRDLSLVATINGKKSKHHVKVGFSPEQIKPYTQEPADFWEFWQKQVAESGNRPSFIRLCTPPAMAGEQRSIQIVSAVPTIRKNEKISLMWMESV